MNEHLSCDIKSRSYFNRISRLLFTDFMFFFIIFYRNVVSLAVFMRHAYLTNQRI
jgi:hypothetical protein